jgi:hypothetical protein
MDFNERWTPSIPVHNVKHPRWVDNRRQESYLHQLYNINAEQNHLPSNTCYVPP